MRSVVVVSGVLGIGTVLVFAAAAFVSLAFPNGARVAAGWNGGSVWAKDGIAVPAPVPAPMVLDANGGVVVEPDPAVDGK